jgi:hypothetical protein
MVFFVILATSTPAHVTFAANGERTLLPIVGNNPSIATINSPGFGDKQNDYAWSMAWFKGKLYVGTSHKVLCVERATLAFYYPDADYYSTRPDEGFSCPADPYDLDLRAEIWQFTPGDGTYANIGRWKQVYQSPNTIPNPREAGKFVSPDIGFRGMVVYKDPGGEEALYVLGVTADEYIPELATTNPPRILRTTDGETYSVVAGAPGTIYTAFGSQKPIGFRAAVVYHDRLFVTVSAGLTGDGVVMEIGNPAGANASFTQVSPQGLQVFEMEVFNDYLYIGTGDLKNGYGVWKTKATGPAPYLFTPVMINGAGRGATITSVVSMYVFQKRLYVGASGWYSTLLPSSELVRINRDDSWDLVVGNPRTVGLFNKSPISGLPDGFANPFNAHFWRMQEHQNTLYLGTNDWSYAFRTVPGLDEILRPQYGFDLYLSCDGQFWFPVTYNAFGHGLYNFGARTLASTPKGGFIGSANYAEGTSVWMASGASYCVPPASTTALSPSTDLVTPPFRLEAETQGGSVVLSWEQAQNASTYQVLRAEYLSNKEVGVTGRQDLPPQPSPVGGKFLPGIEGGGGLPADAWIPGAFTEIGTTAQLFFVDHTAKSGVRYSYQVVAANSQGTTSLPSNLVVVPSLTPVVTFDLLNSTIQEFVTLDKISPKQAQALQDQLASAQAASAHQEYSAAATILADLRVQAAQTSASSDNPALEEITSLMAKLQRRINLAAQDVLTLP